MFCQIIVIPCSALGSFCSQGDKQMYLVDQPNPNKSKIQLQNGLFIKVHNLNDKQKLALKNSLKKWDFEDKKILNVSLISCSTWAFMSHSHFPARNMSK